MAKKKRKRNPKKDNTMWWLLGGAVVLGVGGYYFMKGSSDQGLQAVANQNIPKLKYAATEGGFFDEKGMWYSVADKSINIDPDGNMTVPSADGTIWVKAVDPNGIPWVVDKSTKAVTTAGHSPTAMYAAPAAAGFSVGYQLGAGYNVGYQLGNPWGTAW